MANNTESARCCQRYGANVFNVLILGESQVGKSTLIQAIMQYADPNHVIERDTIGNGITSKTTQVRRFCVDTRYPLHEVRFDAPSEPGELGATSSSPAVKFDVIMKKHKDDWEDYQDALNWRAGIHLHRCPDSKKQAMHHIHLFDTPGLNDTEGDDETHIATIIKGLRDAGGIHLVLIVVREGAFTEGSKSALRSYMDVFPEFQGIITFVHTKFDYAELHPQRQDRLEALAERKGILHSVMGRTSCKHTMVDCDFGLTKWIRKCITLNAIRLLLLEARTNLPVSIDLDRVHKTLKMRTIDNIILNKHTATLDAICETLKTKNTEQGTVLKEIADLNNRINLLNAILNRELNYVTAVNRIAPVFIDQQEFYDDWALFDWNRSHTLEFLPQAFTICQVVILEDNMDITRIRGGMGFKYCEIDFRRKLYRNGALSIKYYASSNELYAEKVREARERGESAERDLPAAIHELKTITVSGANLLGEIEGLEQKSRLGTGVIAMAAETSVTTARFLSLVSGRKYSGDSAMVAEAIEDVYLKEIMKQQEKRDSEKVAEAIEDEYLKEIMKQHEE